MEYIRWFHEIGLADSGLVGGKGANLGELTAAGLPFLRASASLRQLTRSF
jgi:phosphoenolpyruvate synthase/pyruvate phosphate dikinase